MFLQYGDVFLVRCQLLQAEREAVYDTANQYLYTIHRYRVRGVFNPQVNSYGYPDLPGVGDPSGAPNQRLGNFATVTDASLRHYLMQPRQNLTLRTPADPAGVQVVVGNPGTAPFNWVESPDFEPTSGTQYTMDCNNGPTPLSCDVVRVSGTKTFLVDFSIQTSMNEAGLYTVSPTVMLSHVWKIEEDVDQDYYSTRVIDGYARFRADRMLYTGSYADDFRYWLFHARPGGFKRVHVNVRVAEDGNSLVYRLVDKQVALNVLPAGVTRIELTHHVGDSGYQVGNAVKGVVGSGYGFLKKYFSQSVHIMNPLSWDKAAESIIEAAFDSSASAVQAVADAVPVLLADATCRVWGRQNAWRSDLQAVAVDAVLRRLAMSVPAAARFLAGVTLQVTHDCAGTYVEAAAGVRTSLYGKAIQGPTNGAGGFVNAPDPSNYFPNRDDNTPGVLAFNQPAGDGFDLPKQPGVSGAGTRTTFIKRLATASLWSDVGVPSEGTNVNGDPADWDAKRRYPPDGEIP